MKTPINILLSNRVKYLRSKYFITQQKLAELSGVDYKHIQLIEGKNPPYSKLDTLEKLAKAFKMSLSEFLNF
jgi:transcriptional regulator with XRE-family HTH domain